MTDGKRNPHTTRTLHPPTSPHPQPHLENIGELPSPLRRSLVPYFAELSLPQRFCVISMQNWTFRNFWELCLGVLRSSAPKFAELASRVLQKFGTRSPKRVSEALLLVLLAVFFWMFFWITVASKATIHVLLLQSPCPLQEATPTIYQKPTKNAIRGEGKKNKQRAFTHILDFCKKSSENFSEAFRSPYSILICTNIIVVS